MKRKLTALLLSLILLLPTALPVCATMDVDSFTADIFAKEQTVAQGDCAVFCLKSDNSLWAWGNNRKGDIGNGKGFEPYFISPKWYEPFIDIPYKVLDNVRDFSATETWAITYDNKLYVWGETSVLLGLTDNALTFKPQKYMDDVISFSFGAITATDYTSMPSSYPEEVYNMYAVKSDGTLLGWGKNVRGELGDGTKIPKSAPTPIMDGVRYVKYVEGWGPGIAPYAGYGHIFIIKADNSLWGWGADAAKMQDARWGKWEMTPKKHLDNVKYIGTKNKSAIALTYTGELYVWGEISGYVPGARSYGVGGVSNLGTSYAAHYFVEEFYKIGSNIREAHIPTSLNLEDICYITNNNEAFSWNGGVSTKISDNVLSMCGKFYLKTNGELYQYKPYTDMNQVLDAPKKLLDGVVGIVDTFGGTAYAVKSDGTLWGTGKDVEHKLMGKGFNLDKFVYLTDNVKLPYESTPVSVVVPEQTVGNFRDVPVSQWYAEAVRWAVDNNIASGTANNAFSPDRICSEAEILTFMYRASGSPEISNSHSIEGISPDDYCYNAVMWAYDNGMIDRTWQTKNAPCSRATTVYFLWQLAGKPEYSGEVYDDIPESAEYASAVLWADDNNITGGVGNNKFAPELTCTRAQIITFLYRMLG